MNQDSTNLDLLRSVAVLLVLMDHVCTFYDVRQIGLYSTFQMGHLGVLLFFVHTSLVLMLSLERQQQRTAVKSLFAYFMLRRFFRIYPLSMLAVLCIFIWKLPLTYVAAGKMDWISVSFSGFLANFFLVQNLTYSGSVLGPLWSLPIEIQMYLFLPGIYLFANRAKSVSPLLLLWVLAVGAALGQSQIHGLGRFDLLSYVPNFLPGIIAYKFSSLRRHQWPALLWPACLFALITLFMLVQRFENGWVVCLLAGLAIPNFKELSYPFVRNFSHTIAKYSYGIYLGHFFCIWIAFVALGGYSRLVQWSAFVALIIAIPVFMFHLVEAPMIAYGGRVANRLFGAESKPVLRAVPQGAGSA